MKSARAKGLDFCREVRKILEGIGHRVEGPFYGVAYFNNHMNPIHKDAFSIFDLMSWDGDRFIGHQVSTDDNKGKKVKQLVETKLPGWVWCRFSDEDQGAGFDVFVVAKDGTVESSAVTYGLWHKPKGEKHGSEIHRGDGHPG